MCIIGKEEEEHRD